MLAFALEAQALTGANHLCARKRSATLRHA
jgi:hypothetical protein